MATKVREQWVFPDVMSNGKRGTIRVTRKLREGLRMNYETNTLSVVTYYDVTWRGDDGGVERGVMSPESLDKLRNPPADARPATSPARRAGEGVSSDE